MKPAPYNKEHVKIWRDCGENTSKAAGIIGISPTTLRSRLILWGTFVPRSGGRHCRDCKEVFFPLKSQRRCPPCERKHRRQKTEEKAARKPKGLGVEQSQAPPPRHFDCRFYDRCLTDAALKNQSLKCRGCRSYTARSLKEVVETGGPTCAGTAIAAFMPEQIF